MRTRFVKHLLCSVLLGTLLLAEMPIAMAVPARRGGNILPPEAMTGTCEESSRRFRGGRGRRPGATVVVVDFRQEIRDISGTFIPASTVRAPAQVQGDEVEIKLIVMNNSIYDVGSVSLKHSFTPSEFGPQLESFASVRGASLDRRRPIFRIDRIRSSESAEITFRLLLNGNVRGGISESVFELTDYVVLESERRFLPRTPETPPGRSRQTVQRLGIGNTSVICYTAIGRSGRSPVTRIQPRTVEAERAPGSINFRKSSSVSEVHPGMNISYQLVVQNGANREFRNITVDDQFSRAQVTVVDAGGGERRGTGLAWAIPVLNPGDEWAQVYRVRVNEVVRPGDTIRNTMTLISDELNNYPSAQRRVSVEIPVVSSGTLVMPQTGVDLLQIFFLLLQVLLGTVIAFGLFGTGMWTVLRKFE